MDKLTLPKLLFGALKKLLFGALQKSLFGALQKSLFGALKKLLFGALKTTTTQLQTKLLRTKLKEIGPFTN